MVSFEDIIVNITYNNYFHAIILCYFHEKSHFYRLNIVQFFCFHFYVISESCNHKIAVQWNIRENFQWSIVIREMNKELL